MLLVISESFGFFSCAFGPRNCNVENILQLVPALTGAYKTPAQLFMCIGSYSLVTVNWRGRGWFRIKCVVS